MKTFDELVIATGNEGKYREFSRMLKDRFNRIYFLGDFENIPEIEESGNSFSENAFIKACTVAEITGKPALADDSGLVVDALGGEPGIYSARYSGENANDRDNIDKLLSSMAGMDDRAARFVCCLSLYIPGRGFFSSEGVCEGEILEEPRGTSGFGYDPVFYVPDLGRSMAELTENEKNKISHRSKALKELNKVISGL